MKNFLLGLTKFVLGVLLAMVILSIAGLAMARYFIMRISELPERPTYENDVPAEPAPAATSPPAQATSGQPRPTVNLPPGSYQAVVSQPIGLILRDGPGIEYEQIGGVEYETELVVIEEQDGWQKVQLPGGREGWVKGGNIDRL
ncbi:SH3 domain-containing protein [Romeria aff. gracilis LEGE 07310]|uniref:SH3 domain-containing protein n=1 Tax=Vasconcelosia minhoensis LEGE 07310 TaxID=915328 RepID=A0A8J7AP07_9CYAN|nr:SH3 domain-containing protein [Romeria gracilis]MBE9078630.1 SH3 domain-containing protein [Romeria aff. gracilis LEGE 07310]